MNKTILTLSVIIMCFIFQTSCDNESNNSPEIEITEEKTEETGKFTFITDKQTNIDLFERVRFKIARVKDDEISYYINGGWDSIRWQIGNSHESMSYPNKYMIYVDERFYIAGNHKAIVSVYVDNQIIESDTITIQVKKPTGDFLSTQR